jgi:type VI secretion system protein VasD
MSEKAHREVQPTSSCLDLESVTRKPDMHHDRRSSGGALAMALLALLVLEGCSLFGGGDATPAPLDVTVTAGSRLNPDDGGQSLPTVIRIYLLKASSKAGAAQFEDLYRRDKEVLGEDLIQVDEMVLSPGGTARRTVPGDKGARALMVVGVFRRPVGATWRIIAELQKGASAPLHFRAEEYRIERN